MVLEMVTELNLEIYQSDAIVAFLDANVEEEVHVMIASGHETTDKMRVSTGWLDSPRTGEKPSTPIW